MVIMELYTMLIGSYPTGIDFKELRNGFNGQNS